MKLKVVFVGLVKGRVGSFWGRVDFRFYGECGFFILLFIKWGGLGLEGILELVSVRML